MNKLPLILLAAAGLTAGASTPFMLWRGGTPVAVQSPLMLDSLNASGKGFDKSALLSGARNLPLDKGEVLKGGADSALLLGRPSAGLEMRRLNTTLRASRFARGELVVTSPLCYELLVDGKVRATHTDPSQLSTKVKLTLSPERTYDITLRVLTDATDTIAPSLKMSWEPEAKFANVAVNCDPGSKRRFTLDDTMFGPRASGVALSGDGRWLLTVLADMTDIDRTITSATLTDLNTGKVRPLAHKRGMKWMPVSNKLYYKEKGVDGVDLVALDPVTGAVEVLAVNVPDEDLDWNRTETKLYYTKREEPKKAEGPVQRVTSPAERIPGSDARYNIHEYDPATGIDRPLTYGRQQMDIADFHPDGRHLLLQSFTETPTRRPFGDYALYELDTQTMQLDTIVAPTGFLNGGIYSPDGKQIAIAGAPDIFDGLGKNYGSHPIGNDYDRQLFVLDRSTGAIKPLTKDFAPSVSGMPVWSAVDGKLYFMVNEGFDIPLYSIDPRTSAVRKLPMPEGISVVKSFRMSPRSQRIAFLAQGAANNGGTYAYDLKSGKTRTLTEPLAERLGEIEMAQGTPWQFTASDGTLIDGYMFLPPDFDPEKKYPLIVYYYGGTLPTQHGITSPYSPQVFASRDYVVYTLNPSGTVGYGQEFSARHCNAWGKRTAEDIIEGTEKFVAEHPFVDGSRIGCIGASYGGFMTQYLQTLTPMFAAAVSHAGISDVTSYWGEGYWGYSYNSVAAPDSYPWTNPELFTKQGSLFNADKINTPLLLLHGTADTNVPPGESIQLYNALKILGRPVELVTVDGENHFISDYAKRRQWQDTIMAWFARYLQDDPAWWQEMYPED